LRVLLFDRLFSATTNKRKTLSEPSDLGRTKYVLQTYDSEIFIYARRDRQSPSSRNCYCHCHMPECTLIESLVYDWTTIPLPIIQILREQLAVFFCHGGRKPMSRSSLPRMRLLLHGVASSTPTRMQSRSAITGLITTSSYILMLKKPSPWSTCWSH